MFTGGALLDVDIWCVTTTSSLAQTAAEYFALDSPAPIAWPMAKLLDYVLGANEANTYKKAELKCALIISASFGKLKRMWHSQQVLPAVPSARRRATPGRRNLDFEWRARIEQ